MDLVLIDWLETHPSLKTVAEGEVDVLGTNAL